MEESTIDQIREFYQNKKRDWAHKKSYYQGNPEWGTQIMFGSNEPVGYELKPPYLIEEITQYESKINTTLPDDLKKYLTEVSREIFVSYYPIVFNLTSVKIGSFEVPEHKEIWNFADCVTHGRYPQLPEPHTIENNYGSCDCPDPVDGVVVVGEGGCSNTDYLIIRGNHIGEIWSSDGDSCFKKYDSFWKYVTKPLEPIPELTLSSDLVQTAIALNYLLIENGFATLKYNK